MRTRLIPLLLLLAAVLPWQAHAACTTGQTTCNTDTVSNAQIVAAIRDPTVQLSVFYQYLAFCFTNVWGEAASTPGNLARVAYCNKIMAGGVDKATLVAAIMNSTIQGEVLSTSCPAFASGTLGTAAGCMVNVDVGNTIATLMQETVSTATTTASTGAAATTATQATVGATSLVVASALGISVGQQVYAAGVPAGATVTDISGTTVYISAPTTAALSATTIAFVTTVTDELTVASATGIAVGQSVYAPGVPSGTTVQYVSGTTVYLSAPTTAALNATPIAFSVATGLP